MDTWILYIWASDIHLQIFVIKCFSKIMSLQMEHLKRANRLWTNDSLFLHPTLKIPVLEKQEEEVIDFFVSSTSADTTSLSNSSSSEIVGEENSPQSGSDSAKDTCANHLQESSASPYRNASRNSLRSLDSPARRVSSENKDISVKDFLSKIDSETAQIKSNVERLECSTE